MENYVLGMQIVIVTMLLILAGAAGAMGRIAGQIKRLIDILEAREKFIKEQTAKREQEFKQRLDERKQYRPPYRPYREGPSV